LPFVFESQRLARLGCKMHLLVAQVLGPFRLRRHAVVDQVQTFCPDLQPPRRQARATP
jgi:hypothetical protein